MKSTDRYVWVPVRDREASDLFDSGVIVAGCTMALLILLVVAWVF